MQVALRSFEVLNKSSSRRGGIYYSAFIVDVVSFRQIEAVPSWQRAVKVRFRNGSLQQWFGLGKGVARIERGVAQGEGHVPMIVVTIPWPSGNFNAPLSRSCELSRVGVLVHV